MMNNSPDIETPKRKLFLNRTLTSKNLPHMPSGKLVKWITEVT